MIGDRASYPLPESHSREIQSKNKSVSENALTGTPIRKLLAPTHGYLVDLLMNYYLLVYTKGISFFFFIYRRMRFLILGRSVRIKKKNNGIGGLVPQHHCK